MGAPTDFWSPGQTVGFEFQVNDTTGGHVNGLVDGDFIGKELYWRPPGDSTYTFDGAQNPTIASRGQAGLYVASWLIPSGWQSRFVNFTFREGSFTNSAQAWHDYSFRIYPATLVGEADSWTSLYEVLTTLGWIVVSSTTIPTDGQVYIYMNRSAASLTAMLRKAGLNYTTPSGTNPITFANDVEICLANLLANANALEAAARSSMAAEMRDQPGIPERAKGLFELAVQARKDLDGYLKTLPASNYGTAITSTVDSTTEAVSNKPFTMDTEW